MAKQQQYQHKKLLHLDEELWRLIENYRFEHRQPSEAEAMRELLRLGLKHAPKVRK